MECCCSECFVSFEADEEKELCPVCEKLSSFKISQTESFVRFKKEKKVEQ